MTGVVLNKASAPLHILHAHAGDWHAAEVADNSDGTYAVSFTPEKAGPFQLVLSIEGAPQASAPKRAYTGMCIADKAAAEKCGVSVVMTQLVAGQPGKLTLTRADRSAALTQLLLPGLGRNSESATPGMWLPPHAQ